MSYKTVLIRLSHLLIQSDGHTNPKEISVCKQMKQCEKIGEGEYEAEVSLLSAKSPGEALNQTVGLLKKLDAKMQVRCLAWLCLIANADGFMDKKEWHFIYNLYHKELNLPMDEVMAMQRTIFSEMRTRAASRRLAVL